MSEEITNQGIFAVHRAMISHLQAEWTGRLRNIGADSLKIEEAFQFLRQKYSEAHRAYHNLSHINYLLGEAKNIDFEDPDAVFLAIWFHDVIYDPQKNDNEIESAEIAVKFLRELSFPDLQLATVEQMILATQKHSAENLTADGRIFLDLDLSILGAAPEIYQKYSQAIRREYSHVPDLLYRTGRKNILENFLKREKIYFTGNLHERFEKQARLNLAGEIRLLS